MVNSEYISNPIRFARHRDPNPATHLEDTLLDGQQRNVESTTTQVEDQDVLLALALLIQTVSDGGGGRLVDDSEDVQSGDGTGVLGGLPLRVVEVGRDGDDGVLDVTSEVGLGGLLHLDENHGRDFLGGLKGMDGRSRVSETLTREHFKGRVDSRTASPLPCTRPG